MDFLCDHVLVYLILRPDVVSAQGGDTEFSRPSLKGIKGLYVIIETLPKALEKSGLDKDIIRTDVELKLRLAGITVVSRDEWLKLPGTPFLYVKINAISTPTGLVAFDIIVFLEQTVYLKRDTSIGVSKENPFVSASTWLVSAIGTIGKLNVHLIREHIKDKVDEFINAYLSVNPKGGK